MKPLIHSLNKNHHKNQKQLRSSIEVRKLKLKSSINGGKPIKKSCNDKKQQKEEGNCYSKVDRTGEMKISQQVIINQNPQIRCLSQQRNKHKYEKMLSKSDKSQLLSNICSLEEQFDELMLQHGNSRKSNTSNPNPKLFSPLTSQIKLNKNNINLINHNHNLKSEDKYSKWKCGQRQNEGQNYWTNRNGKRSLLLMNKYAPKSTINLLDKKNNTEFNEASKLTINNTTILNQSLSVIASSPSKSQSQGNFKDRSKKYYKLKLKKGINVVSAAKVK